MTEMAITYRLILESPVVLSVPGGDPNSAETLSYISGSAVAGALAGQWQTTKENGGDETFRNLFLDESVRYLNAYPEGENVSRLLPAPLSLCIRKGDPDKIYDLAEPCRNNLVDEVDNDGLTYQYPKWCEGHIRLTDEAVKHRSARQTSAIHHERDRKQGRAKENENPIFSYISLDPGERFIGKILLDDKKHKELLTRLLSEKPLYIGRSRSAQYGRAAATVISCNESTLFIEAGNNRVDSRLVVTLLSDYLGIDINGHPMPEAFLPELTDRLGVELTPEIRFVGMRPVSGYVNKWLMPRAVVPALLAGSVFVLQSEMSPKSDCIEALLWEGLGQRRAEGFGRLAFNWHGLENESENCSIRTPGIETLRELPVAPTPFFPELNDLIVLARKRLVMQDIRHRIVKSAGDIRTTIGNTHLPSRSLMGRLRDLVQNATTAQNFLDFIRDCRNKPADNELERCKLNGKMLKIWLKNVFTTSESFFLEIGYLRGTSLSSLGAEKLGGNLPVVPFPDEIALLWSCQKQYADLVIQAMVAASKGRDR